MLAFLTLPWTLMNERVAESDNDASVGVSGGNRAMVHAGFILEWRRYE